MPVVVTLNPGRIEKIEFTGITPTELALEGAVWQAVRPQLDALDARLRRLNRDVLAGLKREEGDAELSACPHCGAAAD
jgi:hypothetical protein